MDRVDIIMAELAKCSPASFTDSGRIVKSVYLNSESIGIIMCQAAAMRLDIRKLENKVKMPINADPASTA